MRVVFDVLGSTEHSGGMRLHATELIKSWLENWPHDSVTVIGPEWARKEFSTQANLVNWRNESVLHRSFGQLFFSAKVARLQRANVLVSLSPIVSPLSGRLTVCFQHDWRHKLNPGEFPSHQRLYRKLWEVSAKRANFNACISKKAIQETERYARGARTEEVANGRDHARRWAQFPRDPESCTLVTFGHHNNKRPELVISALAKMNLERLQNVRLVVLGARGEYRESLVDLAAEEGVTAQVEFPGFVEDAEYQRIVSTASAIIMPSSDEGFGLPVAEGLYFDIPVVVTSDSGMPEIFGSDVFVSSPDPESLGSAIEMVLGARTVGQVQPIKQTWGQAARDLREAIERQLVADGNPVHR
ncbi:glycosyltransferase [Leucobacter sp. W1038]|uniref:glycosyltransferase n=1 Tax=Leucobacter sp. W1038 TaxID=3438281 RepID=UPI003D9541C0